MITCVCIGWTQPCVQALLIPRLRYPHIYALWNRTHGCFISLLAGTSSNCCKCFVQLLSLLRLPPFRSEGFFCFFFSAEKILSSRRLSRSVHSSSALFALWGPQVSQSLLLASVSNLDQMLGFKKLKFDVDEQLPMKHFNPQCCNVFNFTPCDGVAPS